MVGAGRARAATWVAVGALVTAASAGPSIHIVERDRIQLQVRTLTARTVETDARSFLMDVVDDATAQLDLNVLWPDPAVPRRLRLTASRDLTSAGQLVSIESTLAAADGSKPIRASREILFTSEATTALFEVARSGERVLTLAIDGELTREQAYSARPVVGPHVAFRLEIQWVERGQTVTLETNHLDTFVGQSVSYEFSLGEAGEAESVRLELMPSRMIGETLQLDVDVSGTLPGTDESVSVVGRKEQWLATSNATSSLSLATGEPPTGFVFLVTPRF